MNWTGGRLSRHSRNAEGSQTLKQKQYFAKSRSNLSKGPSTRGSLDWSFFENSNQQATGAKGAFNNSCPLGAGLAIGPTRRAVPRTPERDEGGEQHDQLGRELYHSPPERHRDSKSLNMPIANRSRNDIDENTATQHIPKEHGSIREDRSVNMSGEPQDLTLLKIRMRKVLGKRDWIGADLQRPLKLRYDTARSDHRIGKRRRLSADRSHAISIARPLQLSPAPRTNILPPPRPIGRGRDGKERISSRFMGEPPSQVRISIGGKQVHIGTTSSTNPHDVRGEVVPFSQSSVSGSMLLDHEDSGLWHESVPRGQGEIFSDPSLPHLRGSMPARPQPIWRDEAYIQRKQHNMPKVGSHDPLYFSPNPANKPNISIAGASARNRIPVGSTGAGIHWYPDMPQSSEHEEALMGRPRSVYRQGSLPVTPRRPITYGPTSIDSPAVQRAEVMGSTTAFILTGNTLGSSSETCITSVSKQLSESARKLQQRARDKARRIPNRSPNLEMHHPVPLSSKRLPVLRSVSPASEWSTQAQQDDQKSTLAPAQQLEENVWRTRVLPQGGTSSEAERMDAERGSSATELDEVDMIKTNRENDADLLAQTPRHALKASVAQPLTETDLPENPKSKQKDVGNPFHETGTQRSPLIAKPRNPDEAWMKFILDDEDSGDAVSNGAKTAQHSTSRRPQQPDEESALPVLSATRKVSNQSLQRPRDDTNSSLEDIDGSNEESHDMLASWDGDPPTSDNATQGSYISSPPILTLPKRHSTVGQAVQSSQAAESSASEDVAPQRQYNVPAAEGHSLPVTPPNNSGRNRPDEKRKEEKSGRFGEVRWRKKVKNIYSLSSTEYEEDSVESIEDD
jgi:hypothetical protein